MEDNKNLYFILFALSLGWTVLYADRTSLYPLLSVIGRDFNLNNTQLGTITSSYFLVYVAMQIPGGIVADKVGKKRLIVLGILTAGVSLFCFGLFGKSYGLLVLFAALHGLGAGTYYPCAYGIMLELVDSKHWGTSAAIINLGMSFGLILGLAISGPLYMHFKSYSAIFIGLALFTMALSLLFIKILPEAESRCNAKANFFAVKEVLKNKNLLLLYIAQFCALYGYWTAVTWGATFFKEERGIGMELAGLFVAIAGMSSIIPSLVMGRISDIFGRKKIALILFPLGALTLYLMAHVRTASAIILSLIAYGIIGKSSWDPIAVAWSGSHASTLGNEAASTAMGVFNFFGMMSAVVAPVITGFIRDITGSLVAAYYVAAVLSLLGGSLVILVDEKLPQPDNKLG